MSYIGIGSPLPDLSSLPGQTGGEVEVTLDYPSSSACGDASPFSPSEATPSGGVFSSSPAGLNLNTSTGEVTPVGSTPQTYTISYTVSGLISQFALTINVVQQSTFSYSSSSFQQIGTATPTLAGGTTLGGSFSAPAGVSINTSTGVIDLAASTIGGPYTITYTTPGPCASASTFDISVTAVAVELIDNNFAMEFNGTDEYTSAPNSMSALTGLSVSAWVYPTSYGSGAAESFVSTDSTSPRGFYIGVYNASNFRFAFTTNGTNLTAINTTPGTVDLNVWQHILVTWDQVNLKFYKNGNLLNTVPTTFASNGTFTTTNNLLIGSRQLGNVGMFEGSIDEVAVWSKTLELADIQRIYNATNDNPGKCANLFTTGLGTDLVFWNRMGD